MAHQVHQRHVSSQTGHARTPSITGMHKDDGWTEQEFDLFIQDGRYRDSFTSWGQDLWWVLVEKTTGDALLRVRGVAMGNGMEGYRRLHRWDGKLTDLGLAELRQRVLRTSEAKLERIHSQAHRGIPGIDHGVTTSVP